MKMECRVDTFEADPEGLAIAADINEHLPEEVSSIPGKYLLSKTPCVACKSAFGLLISHG